MTFIELKILDDLNSRRQRPENLCSKCKTFTQWWKSKKLRRYL